jgi:hypothetical protein
MTKRDEGGRGGAEIEGTRDYSTVTLRLPPATKATLTALATLEGRPASNVVEAALVDYVAQLPPARQQALAAFGQTAPIERAVMLRVKR